MEPLDVPAHDVTVAQALELLRDRLPGLLGAVASGSYVVWLGSGISRERLPDLSKVVERILGFLQSNISSDPNCPYRRAFDDALGLAQLSDDEATHVDHGRNFTDWDIQRVIVTRLVNRYSDLLDIEIPGKDRDFILWEVVDVPNTYANGAIGPDAEHYCLAVLVLEGVVPDLVSANWDDLIERAVRELAAPGSSPLTVCVAAQDFRLPVSGTRVLKFHGCASSAVANEGLYRQYLVGRRTQITDWPHDDEHKMMRDEMTLLAAKKKTLMIGLSAQDSNIQDLFSASKGSLAWEWPVIPPAFVFAEESVGTDQRNILRVAYRSTYEGNEEEIAQSAHLRSYGKPLLAAIMLGIVAEKLVALTRLTSLRDGADPEDADPEEWSALERGVEALATLVSAGPDLRNVNDLRLLLDTFAKALSLFRDGSVPAGPTPYSPLSTSPVQMLGSDPNVRSGGLPQAAVAIALLGAEHSEETWALSSASDPEAAGNGPPLRIDSDGLTSSVFFAANSSVAVQLEMNGYVDPHDPETVVIHSASRPRSQQRSPSSPPGRTGKVGMRHVDMTELISESTTHAGLRQRFREEMAV